MPAGRPRSFCMETALDSALTVFWKKGYEGTSLPDLTEAMGINRPSLYAAFGNKESLFMKVLDRYDKKNACLNKFLEESPARNAIEKLLLALVDSLTDPCTPAGCIDVTGALSCSDDVVKIKRELAFRRDQGMQILVARFERAKAEGELPADLNPNALARYYATLMQGMSVQACGGASREDLLLIVQFAMAAWPTETSTIIKE